MNRMLVMGLNVTLQMQFLDVSLEGLLRQADLGTALLGQPALKENTHSPMRGWTRNN